MMYAPPAKFFMVNFAQLKFVCLMVDPAESEYLSFPNRELFNYVQFVKVRRRKLVLQTFGGCRTQGCLRAKIIESGNFFVLCSILASLHI